MGSCILVVFLLFLVPDFLPSVAFPNMQYRSGASGAHDADDAEPAHPLQCGLRSQATKSFVLSSFSSSSSACFCTSSLPSFSIFRVHVFVFPALPYCTVPRHSSTVLT